jgi:hypothetical protein
MTKKRPKASQRVFYTAPRNWRLFQLDWLWTPASLVFCTLAFFPLALIYHILSLT